MNRHNDIAQFVFENCRDFFTKEEAYELTKNIDIDLEKLKNGGYIYCERPESFAATICDNKFYYEKFNNKGQYIENDRLLEYKIKYKSCESLNQGRVDAFFNGKSRVSRGILEKSNFNILKKYLAIQEVKSIEVEGYISSQISCEYRMIFYKLSESKELKHIKMFANNMKIETKEYRKYTENKEELKYLDYTNLKIKYLDILKELYPLTFPRLNKGEIEKFLNIIDFNEINQWLNKGKFYINITNDIERFSKDCTLTDVRYISSNIECNGIKLSNGLTYMGEEECISLININKNHLPCSNEEYAKIKDKQYKKFVVPDFYDVYKHYCFGMKDMVYTDLLEALELFRNNLNPIKLDDNSICGILKETKIGIQDNNKRNDIPDALIEEKNIYNLHIYIPPKYWYKSDKKTIKYKAHEKI